MDALIQEKKKRTYTTIRFNETKKGIENE
jgi:hypothetical protein